MSDYQLELAPAAQRSVTGPGTEKVNRVGNGAVIVVKTTAGSGTSPTVTVKLQGYANGIWYDIPGAATAAISDMASETILTVLPGIAASANVTVNQAIPRLFRAYCTIGGTDTPKVTFSIQATLIRQ